MVTFPAFDNEEKILMKSIFSLKKNLDSIRGTSPEAFKILSILEEYDLMIEIIELVKFVRINQDNVFGRRNPSMKEDDSKNPSIGGLIRIHTHDLYRPFDSKEKDLLDTIILTLIEAKKSLKKGSSMPFLLRTVRNQNREKYKKKRKNLHFSRIRRY